MYKNENKINPTSIKLTMALVSDPLGSFRDESASKIIALYLVIYYTSRGTDSKIINKNKKIKNLVMLICGCLKTFLLLGKCY